MTRKELIYLLAQEHNERTIKLLREFPTLTRDLWMVEDYEEAYRRYKAEKRRAVRQWSRDYVMESYGIGFNTFYTLQKRVNWILKKASHE